MAWDTPQPGVLAKIFSPQAPLFCGLWVLFLVVTAQHSMQHIFAHPLPTLLTLQLPAIYLLDLF